MCHGNKIETVLIPNNTRLTHDIDLDVAFKRHHFFILETG